MLGRYTLLPADRYITELIAAINRSTERIDMIALTIAEDATTRELIDALCRASERGVNVSVGYDLFFTYREIEKTSKRWWTFWNRTQLLRETRTTMRRAGIKVHWFGQFSPFLFFRRTHIKWSIIDDTVYSFGGVNLYHEGLSHIDYMFRVRDASIVRNLRDEHSRIIAAERRGHVYRSHLFGTVSHTVLIDGGKPFDSIIYRHILSYARESERVIYVSQYAPHGKLGAVLKRHSGAELYFNHWRGADDIFNRIAIRWMMTVRGYTTRYTRDRYLHAKFMIFTMPNGREVAITGSHNLAPIGSWLGTREVALETTDPRIIRQLKQFLDKDIKS